MAQTTRSPIGRAVIHRLAEVAIKMGNCEEARDYYQEFVEIARNDIQYVLRHEISGRGGRRSADADRKCREELKSGGIFRGGV